MNVGISVADEHVYHTQLLQKYFYIAAKNLFNIFLLVIYSFT